MILFFDTETTWLPLDYKAPITETWNWPRMVQIARALYEDDWTLVREVCHIIKPMWYEIPKNVSDIHRITTERAEAEGVWLGFALLNFIADVSKARKIVAHNMNFDKKIVWCEMYRAVWQEHIFAWKEIFCTMMSSTSICKIPQESWRGMKWPKLQELHHWIFWENFEDAHDALVDVKACAKCYFNLFHDKNEATK